MDLARGTFARNPCEAATPGARGWRQAWPAPWNSVLGASPPQLPKEAVGPNHSPEKFIDTDTKLTFKENMKTLGPRGTRVKE